MLDPGLDRWTLVRCTPNRYVRPTDLETLWESAQSLTSPGTVAAADADSHDFWCRTTVEVTEASVLTFNGLTFPAEVFLDGEPVAETESMFLPLHIECTAGRHEVVIRFGALDTWLKTRRPRGRWRSSLVSSPGLRWARTTLLGRAPVYGPLPAPVGIWRPVTVTPKRTAAELRITADATNGATTFSGDCAATDGTSVRASVTGPSAEVVGSWAGTVESGRFHLEGLVPEPRRWWPRGYGDQPLYRVTLTVDNEPVLERVFGFRTVDADTRDGFDLRINGTGIFCRGATWSPPDAVQLNVTHDTMREHVAHFARAGATMLRIVGGLVYEQPEFWQACAELGILVWQDAMQATFDPGEQTSELICRELSHVLREVSGNPALAVISGGSETLQQPEMLGLASAEHAMGVIDHALPQLVSEYSDAVYVRASPAPPPDSADLAIRPDSGVAHWFGVGGYLRPIDDVRSAGVRFAAECLAFANPPVPQSVERHFGSAAVAGHHPDWKAGVPRDRGSSWDFEDIRDFYTEQVFGERLLAVRRVEPDRYLQLGRLAVAEAMRECFAYWRRPDSDCTGALVLSGKDLVPGAGWGLLDVDGVAKPALAVLARVWAPVALVLSDAGLSGIRLDLYNDSAEPLSGTVTLVAVNAHGVRTLDVATELTVGARSSVTLHDPDISGVFRDLSHAFRFGLPGADAVDARFRYDQTEVRDALVITPRAGQIHSGLQARLSAGSADYWTLELSSAVALRYVTVDAPGWVPSDNHVHLAANVPYRIGLKRSGATGDPVGTVSSVDAAAAVTLTTGS